MPNYLVTTNGLRLRSGPGISHSIIALLNKDDIVQDDEITGDWVHITTADNKIGWSHRAYLELIEEQSPTPTGNGLTAAEQSMVQGRCYSEHWRLTRGTSI